MEKNKKGISAKTVAWFSIFLALVILLQTLGSYIKIGATSISLVLIPIVLGGALLGVTAGAFLGFVFGLITLIAGLSGADFFTMTLLEYNPLITTLICLGKGVFAGLIPALVYKAMQARQTKLAIFVASALAPIVNTGLFIFGSLFIIDTLKANFIAEGQGVLYFLFIGCAGINFIVELSVNLIAAPALLRLIDIVKRTFTPSDSI